MYDVNSESRRSQLLLIVQQEVYSDLGSRRIFADCSLENLTNETDEFIVRTRNVLNKLTARSTKKKDIPRNSSVVSFNSCTNVLQ